MDIKLFSLLVPTILMLSTYSAEEPNETFERLASLESTEQVINFYDFCPMCAFGQPAEEAFGSQYDSFELIINELKAWIINRVDAPLENTAYSEVWLVPQSAMQSKEGLAKGERVIALHLAHSGFQVSLLRSDWDFGTQARSELLHELVHELQVANGWDQDQCVADMELMAYGLQLDWLLEQGAAIPNDLFIAFRSYSREEC